jgi:hypothetical protein
VQCLKHGMLIFMPWTFGNKCEIVEAKVIFMGITKCDIAVFSPPVPLGIAPDAQSGTRGR